MTELSQSQKQDCLIDMFLHIAKVMGYHSARIEKDKVLVESKGRTVTYDICRERWQLREILLQLKLQNTPCYLDPNSWWNTVCGIAGAFGYVSKVKAEPSKAQMMMKKRFSFMEPGQAARESSSASL